MILSSIITLAVVVTAGIVICGSEDGDYAASVLAKMNSKKEYC